MGAILTRTQYVDFSLVDDDIKYIFSSEMPFFRMTEEISGNF